MNHTHITLAFYTGLKPPALEHETRRIARECGLQLGSCLSINGNKWDVLLSPEQLETLAGKQEFTCARGFART